MPVFPLARRVPRPGDEVAPALRPAQAFGPVRQQARLRQPSIWCRVLLFIAVMGVVSMLSSYFSVDTKTMPLKHIQPGRDGRSNFEAWERARLGSGRDEGGQRKLELEWPEWPGLVDGEQCIVNNLMDDHARVFLPEGYTPVPCAPALEFSEWNKKGELVIDKDQCPEAMYATAEEGATNGGWKKFPQGVDRMRMGGEFVFVSCGPPPFCRPLTIEESGEGRNCSDVEFHQRFELKRAVPYAVRSRANAYMSSISKYRPVLNLRPPKGSVAVHNSRHAAKNHQKARAAVADMVLKKEKKVDDSRFGISGQEAQHMPPPMRDVGLGAVTEDDADDNINEELPERKVGPKEPKVNMLVIFVDSLSRARFFSAFPETIAAMKDISRTTKYGSRYFDFQRANVLGPRTPQNWAPLFCGVEKDEHCETANAGGRAKPLWRAYGDMGYVTYYQDEDCQLNIASHARMMGLHKTDSWRASTDDYEDIYEKFEKEFDYTGIGRSACRMLSLFDRSTWFDGPPEICLNGRYTQSYFIENFKQFISAHKTVPHFGVLSLLASHEPTTKRMHTLDESLAGLLRHVAEANGPNTAVLLVADHGVSYGEWSEKTMQGRLENLLPAVFMALPDRLINRDPNVLQAIEANQQRLITHYDLFTTMMHISQYPSDPNAPWLPPFFFDLAKEIELEAHLDTKTTSLHRPGWAESHMMSLLVSIPKNRTCAECNINARYCSCSSWVSLEPLAGVAMAEFVVGHLNNLIEDSLTTPEGSVPARGSPCHRLVLSDVIKTEEMKSEASWDTIYFRVRFATKTGSARVRVVWEADIAVSKWLFPDLASKVHHTYSVYRVVTWKHVSRYEPFKQCHDSRVNVELCVCDIPEVNSDEPEDEHDLDAMRPSAAVWQTVMVDGIVLSTNIGEQDAERARMVTVQTNDNAGLTRHIAFIAVNPLSEAVRFELWITSSGLMPTRPVPLRDTVPPKSTRFLVGLSPTGGPFEYDWTVNTKELKVASEHRPYVPPSPGEDFDSLVVRSSDSDGTGVYIEQYRYVDRFVYQVLNRRSLNIEFEVYEVNNLPKGAKVITDQGLPQKVVVKRDLRETIFVVDLPKNGSAGERRVEWSTWDPVVKYYWTTI